MTHLLTSRGGLTASVVLGVLLTCCTGSSRLLGSHGGSGKTAEAAPADLDPWYQAMGEASQAAQLTATATTAAQWNQVAMTWGRSIALLQDLPADDPRQVFGQRNAREYRQNLYLAQQQAAQQLVPRAFPTLGSDVLDEQVSLYRSYVAALGPPDVLIVGSSRSLQGIDPQVLQQALALEGYPGLRVYNFSVNGATAQVVSFITRQLLAPDMYPRLIIWAEGSRALNSSRFDRTFAEILASPGYAAVREGTTLSLQTAIAAAEDKTAAAELVPEETAPEESTTEATAGAEPEASADVPPETEAAHETEAALDMQGDPEAAGEPAAEAPGDSATADGTNTVPISAINSQGFLAVNDQFNPAVYYRSFPLVRGLYDNDYRPFRLDGVQTVSFGAITQFLQSQNIPLVFVNLPLSNDYLDRVRTGYERQFQRFLQDWANRGTLTLVDMLEIWRWQSHLFADPSHVNRYGAREIARLLAADSRIPWPDAVPPDPDAAPGANLNTGTVEEHLSQPEL